MQVQDHKSHWSIWIQGLDAMQSFILTKILIELETSSVAD